MTRMDPLSDFLYDFDETESIAAMFHYRGFRLTGYAILLDSLFTGLRDRLGVFAILGALL